MTDFGIIGYPHRYDPITTMGCIGGSFQMYPAFERKRKGNKSMAFS